MRFLLLFSLFFAVSLGAYAQDDTAEPVELDQVPIYPGCEGTNEQLKACMKEKVSLFINRKFNMRAAERLDLPAGQHKMLANFKIDSKGNVVNIKITGDHEDLNKLYEKALKKLPKMEPGMQNGKPVGVMYSMPVYLTF